MRCSDEYKQTEHIIGKYSNGEYTTEEELTVMGKLNITVSSKPERKSDDEPDNDDERDNDDYDKGAYEKMLPTTSTCET